MALNPSQPASATKAAPAGPWQDDAARWALDGAAACRPVGAAPPVLSVTAAATAPAATTAPAPTVQCLPLGLLMRLVMSLTLPSRRACWREPCGPAWSPGPGPGRPAVYPGSAAAAAS